MSLANFSLTAKVTLLLLLVGAVALGGAGFSASRMLWIDALYSELLEGPSAGALKLVEADRALSDVTAALYRNAASTTEAGNAVARSEREKAEATFVAEAGSAAKALGGHAAEINALVQDVKTAMSVTCSAAIRLANSTDPDANAKALHEITTVCAPALAQAQSKLDTLTKTVMTELDRESTELTATSEWSATLAFGSILTGTALIVLLAVWLIRSGVSTPLTALLDAMRAMQAGNFAVRIDGAARKDEVGTIAAGLESFRASLAAAADDRTAQEAARASDEVAIRNRAALAEDFVARMEKLAVEFTKSSAEVADAAKNLSATAEETSRQTQAVAGAAEEASANVQTAAAGTEELAASVREISNQVSMSSASPERRPTKPRRAPATSKNCPRPRTRSVRSWNSSTTSRRRPICWPSTPPSRLRGRAKPDAVSRWWLPK